MTASKSILVTGGAGYIGAHCCRRLHEAGFLPVCLDNLSTGHRAFVKWGPLVIGDLRDTSLLEATLKQYDISAVIHLAAASSARESTVDPAKYYSNNVLGTLALLDAMQAADCRNLVFSSSAAVYGDKGDRPIAERSSCDPVSPYGRTKLICEQMIGDFQAASSLRAISLRCFNAAGADDSCVIGELHDPETHLIPRAMMKLLGHAPEFGIFGDDYDTSDGTAVRDYVHVADLAEAHCLALDALLAGLRHGTFNAGSGAGRSVSQIIATIGEITTRELGAVRRPRGQGEPAVIVADPTYAKRTLRFSADRSDFRTIIASAWKWHQLVHPDTGASGV